MYQSLHGAESKKAVLLAAAQKALPSWKYVLLQAVLKVTKSSRDERNDFAHHVWGTAEELPGALLLMHPNVVLEVNVSHRASALDHGRGIISPRTYDATRVMVY